MKAIFKCKQAGLSLTHEHLFQGGVAYAYRMPRKPGTFEPDYEEAKKQGIKAPEMFGKSYCFIEGEQRNRLTLSTEEEIQAMREYINSRGDEFIEEVTE